MPRIARVVAQNYPHHVTQRGNYQQKVFAAEDDYRQYLQWLRQYSEKNGLDIWAYCLMSNHVHFVCVPRSDDALAKTFNTLHMRYSQYFNNKNERSGHLWQGRFYSCILDEPHTYAAIRYVENNPIRAGLAERAEDYPWSSAGVHVEKNYENTICQKCFLTDEIQDWRVYLSQAADSTLVDTIKKNALTGRPCGTDGFIAGLESRFNRRLRPLAHGRPRKEAE